MLHHLATEIALPGGEGIREEELLDDPLGAAFGGLRRGRPPVPAVRRAAGGDEQEQHGASTVPHAPSAC